MSSYSDNDRDDRTPNAGTQGETGSFGSPSGCPDVSPPPGTSTANQPRATPPAGSNTNNEPHHPAESRRSGY